MNRIFIILFCLLLMTGCSYHQWEENLKTEGKQFLENQGKDNIQEEGSQKAESSSEDNTESVVETRTSSNSDNQSTSKTKENQEQSEKFPQDKTSKVSGVNYEIEKISAFNNWNEADIETEEMRPVADRELAADMAGNSDKIFLVLDIKATREKKHIMTDSWEVSVDSNMIFDATDEEENAIDVVYFSDANEEADEDNYGRYILEMGQKKQFQVGYFVEKEKAESGVLEYVLDFNSDRREMIPLGVIQCEN